MSELTRPAPDLQELYDALKWWTKRNEDPSKFIPAPEGNRYIIEDYWYPEEGPVLCQVMAGYDALNFLDELMTKKMERESNE